MDKREGKDWFCYDEDNQMIIIKNVEPLDDYKLLLTFSNGERKIYDAIKTINKNPLLNPLKNFSLFKTVHIEFGTVAWNDQLDICPEELYWNSTAISKKSS